MKKKPTTRRLARRETTDEVSSAGSRLLTMKRKKRAGEFWFTHCGVHHLVTDDVLACAGTAVSQDQTKGKRKVR